MRGIVETSLGPFDAANCCTELCCLLNLLLWWWVSSPCVSHCCVRFHMIPSIATLPHFAGWCGRFQTLASWGWILCSGPPIPVLDPNEWRYDKVSPSKILRSMKHVLLGQSGSSAGADHKAEGGRKEGTSKSWGGFEVGSGRESYSLATCLRMSSRFGIESDTAFGLPPQSGRMGLSENRIDIPKFQQIIGMFSYVIKLLSYFAIDMAILVQTVYPSCGACGDLNVPSGAKNCSAPCERFRQQVATIPRWSQGATYRIL